MACIRKWRGSWVVDWRDPSGKRFIETVDGDRDAAKRRLAEVLKTGEQGSSKRLTFKDYGDWWLKNVAEGSVAASTYEEYKAVLRNHVYPTLGSKPFTKVNREMIRELIAAKKKEIRGKDESSEKKGFSQSTIRNIMAPVRGMFFQAMEDGKVFANPAARAGKLNKRKKDEPKKEINPLTADEVQTMLKTATEKYSHHYPLFLCAPRTGIRQGELVALKGIDVDFNGRFINVVRNLSRGTIKLPKNGKTRKVDMSNQLAAVLKEMLSKRRADALRAEMEKPADERRDAATVVNEVMEDWLFQTPVIKPSEAATRRQPADHKPRGGTQIDPSNLRKVFNRLLTDAGLRRVRFHDLRHTFASLLLQNGESPVYVKEQCGHSSIQVTVDIYGHLVPGGNRQAVDRLDDAISNVAKNAVNN
jgi:integrase